MKNQAHVTQSNRDIYTVMLLLWMRAATRQPASSLHGATVCFPSITLQSSLYPPDVHRRQMWTMEVGLCACATPTYVACLPFNQRVLQTLWVGDGLDVCHALTIVALIIAVCYAMCICAGYRFMSGRRDIVPKPSHTAANNTKYAVSLINFFQTCVP